MRGNEVGGFHLLVIGMGLGTRFGNRFILLEQPHQLVLLMVTGTAVIIIF